MTKNQGSRAEEGKGSLEAWEEGRHSAGEGDGMGSTS